MEKRGHCRGVTVLGHLWAVQVRAKHSSVHVGAAPLGTAWALTLSSLPGSTYRNAGPWQEGKEGGVWREAVTAALVFLPRR